MSGWKTFFRHNYLHNELYMTNSEKTQNGKTFVSLTRGHFSGFRLGCFVPNKVTHIATDYNYILDNNVLPTLCQLFVEGPFLSCLRAQN